MAGVGASRVRVTVDGKFFRAGEKKFYVKGVGYGPFTPNAAGQPFASLEQTAADFTQIRQLGPNLLRVYAVPGKWFLDMAAEHGLKVLIDVPWNKRLCFLDSQQLRADALNAVRRAVYACARHPAVFAFSVANEIPPDVVRWSGTHAVADFIDELVLEAKGIDSECLCTFTNYPPTEFLRPQNLDFVSFNVYLHNEQPFRNYLARLQMLADAKPLLLGEIGIDSFREGEARKCRILQWQVEAAFRGGLAGAAVFNYTDDWWHGGHQVEGWAMGLTTRDRQPKESFFAVQKAFKNAPHFPLSRWPRISVVVASFNGDRTLKACLESLQSLNYPDYEIILVDDGSTDTTPQIAYLNPQVRYIRHQKNLGLSTARNTGIATAAGEIIAFTDSDCRADEDWLYYLAGTLLDSDFAGVGGPNLFPPEDSAVAAAVMASPGGPAHVMLTDRQAEHIPGCNMAFYKWTLVEVGGFDPIFRRAGDDVDMCWRVQQAGYKIGFSPSAFVWHYRRSAVQDYLVQQEGYGEAEAMLVRKHPEYFNTFGGSIWRGRIYTSANFGVLIRPSIIYRGLFGGGGFQALYASQPAVSLMLFTSLEYHVLVTLPLWLASISFRPVLPVAITSLLVSLAVCVAAGAQAQIPREKARWWSRLLVAVLFFLQPIVRGWARYRGRLTPQTAPLAPKESLDSLALLQSKRPLDETRYWSERPIDRLALVTEMLRRLEQQGWPVRSDIGWSEYDLEAYDTRWSKLQLTTVTEEHPRNRQCVRIRLRPRWSLRASVAFWTLCGLQAFLLSWFAAGHRWLWLILLSLPLAWLFLRHENRKLQSVIRVFLDELAKEWNLTRVEQPVSPPGSSQAPIPPPASAAD